jgi:hypothetical protein
MSFARRLSLDPDSLVQSAKVLAESDADSLETGYLGRLSLVVGESLRREDRRPGHTCCEMNSSQPSVI